MGLLCLGAAEARVAAVALPKYIHTDVLLQLNHELLPAALAVAVRHEPGRHLLLALQQQQLSQARDL